jgi:TldD protein
MAHEIDQSFRALPRAQLADAALSRARELGVEHADFRLERVRGARLAVHDGELEGAVDGEDTGFAVRVVHDGTWGFAGGVDLTPEVAVQVAELAVEVAKTSRPISTERVELADEPVYADVEWVSGYDVNPFDVSEADKIALLAGWSRRLMAASGVDHAKATV